MFTPSYCAKTIQSKFIGIYYKIMNTIFILGDYECSFFFFVFYNIPRSDAEAQRLLGSFSAPLRLGGRLVETL
jgi:hypothetical protein